MLFSLISHVRYTKKPFSSPQHTTGPAINTVKLKWWLIKNTIILPPVIIHDHHKWLKPYCTTHKYSAASKYHLLCLSALSHLFREPPGRCPPQPFQVPAKQLGSPQPRCDNTSHSRMAAVGTDALLNSLILKKHFKLLQLADERDF